MAELLADHTTFRVGGPARAWAEPETEAELIDLVSSADARGEPVLILGGGSNVLVADAGFDGTVIQLGRLRGVHTEDVAACSGAFIDVAAGEPWDAFVERSVHAGHVGVEALSGIPGLVGATPIQNVGAYGQEVSQTIARVRLWDRQDRKVVTRSVAECHFGYRRSLFKAQPGRWVVLSVSFQFRLGELSTPVRYAELAKALGIQPGERAPLAKVRRTVLQLRRGKGMVLDQADADTWSAGSFFTNPTKFTMSIRVFLTTFDDISTFHDRAFAYGHHGIIGWIIAFVFHQEISKFVNFKRYLRNYRPINIA